MTAAAKPLDRWEADEFELLTVHLTNDIIAVFADVADDGLTDLFWEPCDAIGIARVTRRFYAGYRGQIGSVREVRDPDVESRVVGLQLLSGNFSIANDNSNFSGLAKAGNDIWLATDFLDRHKYKTLRHDPRDRHSSGPHGGVESGAET